jgi:hypothetical protein
MNAGMDEDVAPKKQPEVFEGPLLSSRDKAKIERKKRKDERQREVMRSSLCQWLLLDFLTTLCLCLYISVMEILAVHTWCFSIFNPPLLLFFAMVDANVFLPDYTLLYAVLLAGAGTIPNACCRDGGAQGWNASCFCKS